MWTLQTSTCIDIESNRAIISSNRRSSKGAPASVALGRPAQPLKHETSEGEAALPVVVRPSGHAEKLGFADVLLNFFACSALRFETVTRKIQYNYYNTMIIIEICNFPPYSRNYCTMKLQTILSTENTFAYRLVLKCFKQSFDRSWAVDVDFS